MVSEPEETIIVTNCWSALVDADLESFDNRFFEKLDEIFKLYGRRNQCSQERRQITQTKIIYIFHWEHEDGLAIVPQFSVTITKHNHNRVKLWVEQYPLQYHTNEYIRVRIDDIIKYLHEEYQADVIEEPILLSSTHQSIPAQQRTLMMQKPVWQLIYDGTVVTEMLIDWLYTFVFVENRDQHWEVYSGGHTCEYIPIDPIKDSSLTLVELKVIPILFVESFPFDAVHTRVLVSVGADSLRISYLQKEFKQVFENAQTAATMPPVEPGQSNAMPSDSNSIGQLNTLSQQAAQEETKSAREAVETQKSELENLSEVGQAQSKSMYPRKEVIVLDGRKFISHFYEMFQSTIEALSKIEPDISGHISASVHYLPSLTKMILEQHRTLDDISYRLKVRKTGKIVAEFLGVAKLTDGEITVTWEAPGETFVKRVFRGFNGYTDKPLSDWIWDDTAKPIHKRDESELEARGAPMYFPGTLDFDYWQEGMNRHFPGFRFTYRDQAGHIIASIAYAMQRLKKVPTPNEALRIGVTSIPFVQQIKALPAWLSNAHNIDQAEGRIFFVYLKVSIEQRWESMITEKIICFFLIEHHGQAKIDVIAYCADAEIYSLFLILLNKLKELLHWEQPPVSSRGVSCTRDPRGICTSHIHSIYTKNEIAS